MDLEQFVRGVIEHAIKSGRTEYWVSRRAGIHQSRLTAFRQGAQGITLDTATSILDGLGVDLPSPDYVAAEGLRKISQESC